MPKCTKRRSWNLYMYKNSLFMLVFQSLHGLAPAYFILNEFSHALDFHSYNTHHRDLLRLPLARTTKYQGSFRFNGAKIWNTLPLAVRSKHYLNKFGLGLKRTLDPSQIEPPILSLYLVILIFFFICYCFFVFFFSFHQGPIQTSIAQLGTTE